MSNCGNRRKHNCGSGRVNSVCVKYEGDIPEWSDLKDEECVVVEETIEDLYKNIDKIKNSIDTSELDNDCFDYPKTKDGDILVKDVLLAFEKKLCNLDKTSDGSCCDISGIDTKCLVDECGAKPKDIKELLQLIINKICE